MQNRKTLALSKISLYFSSSFHSLHSFSVFKVILAYANTPSLTYLFFTLLSPFSSSSLTSFPKPRIKNPSHFHILPFPSLPNPLPPQSSSFHFHIALQLHGFFEPQPFLSTLSLWWVHESLKEWKLLIFGFLFFLLKMFDYYFLNGESRAISHFVHGMLDWVHGVSEEAFPVSPA